MLFVNAFCALLAYDFLNVFCRFEVIYSIVKTWKVTSKPANYKLAEHIAAAVNYACIWYPKRAYCLQRSFAMTYLLRRAGLPAQLVIGAKKLPFKAHAWVEVDGVPINETLDVKANYMVWERC